MYSLSRLIGLSPFGEIQLFKEPRYLIVRTARSQRRIDFFPTFIESCSDIELKGCSLLEIGFNPSEAKMERNRSNRLINNRLCVSLAFGCWLLQYAVYYLFIDWDRVKNEVLVEFWIFDTAFTSVADMNEQVCRKGHHFATLICL